MTLLLPLLFVPHLAGELHLQLAYDCYTIEYRIAGINFCGKSEKASKINFRGFKFRGSIQFRGVAPRTSDDVIDTHARFRSRSSLLLLQILGQIV